MNKQKLLIICGPTATGKTELGIKLAEKFNGEIVSADSRQVYKGMDIGTGKDLAIYKKHKVKIWGLDLVKPDYQFNVGEYKTFARQAINDIQKQGKLPIVVGGTGLYIKALVEPMNYVNIPPNKKLRKIVGYYEMTRSRIASSAELKKRLRDELVRVDKNRLERMNNSDKNNPRRLIRAIEIAQYLYHRHSGESGEAGRLQNEEEKILLIGLTASKEILFKRIAERIKKRLEQRKNKFVPGGIIEEIEKLLQKGYGWNLPSMSGIGYKEFKSYFEKKESLEEVVRKWQVDEQNFAKRQLVWFSKMPNILWFDIQGHNFYTKVKEKVCEFLKETS